MMRHLYFGIFEGIWGASLGKALVGLRVARLNRSAPGIPRALLRSVLLQAFLFAEMTRYVVSDVTQVTAWTYLWLAGQILFFLLFFVSARRQNGFAGLHDLWTGTRVIQKAAYQPRVAMTQTEDTVATTDDMQKIGPFHVIATLSDAGDQEILLGYDTRLLRKVWIRQTPAGSPPVSQAQRNIARPGRLRWLQGERNEHESWDAYEAASGSPLTSLVTTRQSWRVVRHWLHDVAAELEAATQTASLPDILTLDRVWITAEGRAKLLDFAAPGSVSAAAGDAPVTAQAFLHQVAIAALEGRMVSALEAAGRSISEPLPLPARQTLLGLRSTTDLRSLATRLQILTQQPAEISRWRRFALLFGTLAPSLFLTAFMVVGLMFYQSWAAKNPAFATLGGCMLSYESMLKNVKEPGLENIPVPEAKAAMETYIAGTHGPIVRDALQWETPIARSLLSPKLRATVEKIVQDHPQPTAEEVSKARALLQPLLETRIAKRAKDIGLEGRKYMLDFISLSVMGVYLLFTAFFSLFCAVAFRGGLMMRILGIAVVTDTGADASRLRMLWRSLVAWSPILLMIILFMFAAPLMEKAGAQAVPRVIGLSAMVVLSLALSLAAITTRGRGLHDRLARTWLVPR